MPQAKTIFKEKILEKITDLPDYKLKEVLDFIEFLRSKREENEDPILRVAGYLSGNALSAGEIEEELFTDEVRKGIEERGYTVKQISDEIEKRRHEDHHRS